MTKKEIKAMTNAELIMQLCRMMYGSQTYKWQVKAASMIYEELQNRNVIENSQEAFEEWFRLYRA